jgi:hypothetical protein
MLSVLLCCEAVTIDLDAYSTEAERFVSALDREYYLHFAGHKEEFEIEAIYERHRDLFDRPKVEQLRELADATLSGDDRRRSRYLLELAVDGLIGHATKAEAAALAEREAALEVRVDGERIPFRQATIVQANEADPERRFAIEQARLELLETELNPLHREMLERTHAISIDLGWESSRAMYEELKGIDLSSLERETRAFAAATSPRYRELVEPELRAQTGLGFDRLRRSDLPYFFRATTFDETFPADRLLDAFDRTLQGLGIELRSQPNVKLDLEQRPRKSPRAFCAPVRVPDEIYLVVPRKGGRDDYSALFHEGGHVEHYAGVDPHLPFEFRHLGDNSVTEAFAFLFEHLIEDPAWLGQQLGADELSAYLGYTRASKLIFLRRYAAKLRYELALHGGERPLESMPALYSGLLGEAVGVEWPSVMYLADVDTGYYAANYLRAWAFEAQLRRALRGRFGEDWFARREAGDYLRSLWRDGQRLDADELLARTAEERLDFGVLLEEVGSAE